MTFEQIKKDESIKTYIRRADESLGELGYTEHSFAHVSKVAETAGYILQTMGYDERTVELAKIAGYLHDIGNLVNRSEHSQSGAVMAFRILDNLGMDAAEIAANGFGKSTQQHGFSGSGHIFQQNMTGADEAGQYERDGIVFADDYFRAVFNDAVAAFGEEFQIQNDLPFKIRLTF